MSIITFGFIFFLIISVVIYYIIPRKFRWVSLLISSLIFFFLSCSWQMFIILVIEMLATYFGTILIKKDEKHSKLYLIGTLISIIGFLFMLKYFNIVPLTFNLFANFVNSQAEMKLLNLMAPIGISYYSLSMIGYVVDVYWGKYPPQKNFLKHALFCCFYPMMVSGPIMKYNEVEGELFNKNKLDWSNIYQGSTRILYGLMKKMVVADNLSIVVTHIFANYTTYSGLYIILGLIFYALQIYCDFSGCMDIVIGAAKMYGIKMPENFNAPFFSTTLSEFWRRWHISLGGWAKDYIMYPLLKTNLFQKINTTSKKILGKKYGKKIPTILAISILWLLIGIWHGASFKYIFASGFVPWIYLSAGELFEPLTKKISKYVKTDTFSFRLFQRLRTLGLMCFVWLFVCAPSLSTSPDLIKHIFIPVGLHLLPTLPQIPYALVSILLAIVFVIDYLKYININVSEKFQEQNFLFKLWVVYSLIIIILLYGCYGPAYNAIDFIYGGF